MQVPFHQYSFDQQEENAVLEVLRSGWLTTGKKAEAFETAFESFKKTGTALAVNSCTSGLFLILKSLNLNLGDEVITTPWTFAASANVIIHNNLTPVFADIDPQTLNISPESILTKITPKTKAIIVVHVAGNMCQMDKILEICNEHNLYLIEDCAHAIESEFDGNSSGSIGYAGAFSFYPNKNVTTSEGGMILLNNPENTLNIKSWRNHGFDYDAFTRFQGNGFKQYDIAVHGYKMNMTDLTAALGLVQFSKIEDFWIKRQLIFNQYVSEISSEYVSVIQAISNSKSAYHLCILKLDLEKLKVSREVIMNDILTLGVQLTIHFKPIYEFKAFQPYLLNPLNFHNTEKLKNAVFSIPLFPKMTQEQVNYIIEVVNQVVMKYKK